MPDQVVHGVQGLAKGDGERLCRRDPDHQGAGEAGATRHRDGVELLERHARLVERRLERRHDRLEVCPRGNFGHDAAVSRVLVHRAGDHVGEQLGASNDPHAGLVTAGLDAEDERGHHVVTTVGSGSTSRMTTASTPSGW